MRFSENNSKERVFISYRRSTTRSLFAIKSRYSEPKREVINELAEGKSKSLCLIPISAMLVYAYEPNSPSFGL